MISTRVIVSNIPRQDETMAGCLMTADYISESGNRSTLAERLHLLPNYGDNVMFIRLTNYLQNYKLIKQATCQPFEFGLETDQVIEGMNRVNMWNYPGPAECAGWMEVVIQGDPKDLHVSIAGFNEATGKTSISKRLETAESGYISTLLTNFSWQAVDTFEYICIDHADSFSCQNNYEVTL